MMVGESNNQVNPCASIGAPIRQYLLIKTTSAATNIAPKAFVVVPLLDCRKPIFEITGVSKFWWNNYPAYPVNVAPFPGFFITNLYSGKAVGKRTSVYEVGLNYHFAGFVDKTPFPALKLSKSNRCQSFAKG